MGLNINLAHMLGAPTTTTCPKCSADVKLFTEDFDIEAGNPNPTPGKWKLDAYCPSCDLDWQHEITLITAEKAQVIHDKLIDKIIDIGVYPEKVIGGPTPYDKRTQWMEGWNACATEVTKNYAQNSKGKAFEP